MCTVDSEEEDDDDPRSTLLQGSLTDRVHNIRNYCVQVSLVIWYNNKLQHLGIDQFEKAYKYMKSLGSSTLTAQQRQQVAQWVGRDRLDDTTSLIAQLLFCEEALG